MRQAKTRIINLKIKKGFTLIEIVAVLIIVGVLATMALSNIFLWISKSTVSEAMTTMSAYKNVIEACIQTHPGSEGQCSSSYIALPSDTKNFRYCQLCGGRISMIDYAPYDGIPNWNFSACGLNSPIVSLGMFNSFYADCITLTRTDGGVYTCLGRGTFQGVC
jgi:prepilin-type N-terminal cleavage/methylation domain-containing protein